MPPHTIPLADGRVLSYAEYGDPAGQPVLWCHGNPGSRDDVALVEEEVMQRAGVRVIAPDRPGIGGSTFKPQRKLAEWPADVAEMMAALQIDRFALLGLSAGAPYALAVAAAMPARITRTSILSGVGILDALSAAERKQIAFSYFALARRSYWLLRGMVWLMRRGLNNPDKMLEQATKSFPPSDQAMMADPRIARVFMQDMATSMQQGTRGMAWDAVLVARPWEIDLAAITGPVTLWHGDADRNAPVAMAHQLHARLPHSRLHILPDEGHFSLGLRHFDTIIREVATGEAGISA